ncbi:uncharacterized protein LOC5513218 [Nematostella vectensis]|uniref:uncharacterized protein LOC5513218 n=1 Tax=Nematostella vectensis TaxID=45351 RepID=UPI0020778D58|nr:uncharacterized protein LOC5513218 [Nematostella vectensis]
MMQEIQTGATNFCDLERNSSNCTSQQFMPPTQQHITSSPTDIHMTSLESEESDNSNPELERALEAFVSQEIQGKINKILEDVQQLSDTEKLLLYLRLPGESCSDTKDEFEQNQGLPISTTRAEQTQAFHWIRCHLEECDNSSTLPKHEVYDEYKAYCESMSASRTLSAPDFGKIIKCVFPRVKARRLGTRGNSKYCYSGIQRKKNVKPPTLPSLQIPVNNDRDKANGGQGNGMNGGDKIEEDQTLSAACLLVCEWANKLLGRVFTTLIELARFLVGGSYVSSKSMAAFVVMSSTENQPQTNQLTLFSPQKVEDPIVLTHKRRQTQQQFQKKIHQRQQQKQIHQSLGHTILPQATGQPTQIISKSQSEHPRHNQPMHVTLKPAQGPAQFYQPSPPHPSLQGSAPPTPTNTFPKMRPLTPSLMSPTSQGIQQAPQTPSFQASPKFNPPGTPQNRPVTPSSGSTTRQTPNSIEPTRFHFTPITNGTHEQKGQRGEVSPPTTLRPTATHPGNQVHEWQPGGSQNQDVPLSPTKQPRLTATPTRRPVSFPYPLSSPRTPQRMNQQFVTSPPMMSPNTPHPLMSPNVNQRVQEQLIVQSGNGQDGMVGMRRDGDSSPNMVTDHMIKQGCLTPRPCRYSTSSDVQMPPTPLSQSVDYSAELDSICTVTNAGPMPPPYQRSQSVPPLPQNAFMDKRLQPLTPQTDNRLIGTPTSMDNGSSNQHINGLKELRNRVLHGDVNNNGSRPSPNEVFAARRNLTSLLNAEALGANAHHPGPSNWNTESFHSNQTGSTSSEEQEMEMLETNLNFSDLTSDSDTHLPDFNPLSDEVLRSICNNTSGVWPTSDVGAWGGSHTLQIME